MYQQLREPRRCRGCSAAFAGAQQAGAVLPHTLPAGRQPPLLAGSLEHMEHDWWGQPWWVLAGFQDLSPVFKVGLMEGVLLALSLMGTINRVPDLVEHEASPKG